MQVWQFSHDCRSSVVLCNAPLRSFTVCSHTLSYRVSYDYKPHISSFVIVHSYHNNMLMWCMLLSCVYLFIHVFFGMYATLCYQEIRACRKHSQQPWQNSLIVICFWYSLLSSSAVSLNLNYLTAAEYMCYIVVIIE